jgi:hypothetical protein
MLRRREFLAGASALAAAVSARQASAITRADQIIIIDPLGGASSSPPLAKDLFAGTNGTSLASHTMDIGTGWTQRIGTAALTGSGAVADVTEVSSESLATFALGASDGRYKMTMTPSTSGANGSSTGMIFRYSDNNNYWLLQLFAGDAASHPQAVQLYQKSGGTFTLELAFPLTLTSSVPHNVEIWFKGPTITFTIDGANESTFVSTFNQTATICGIRGSKTGAAPANPMWSNMSVLAKSPALNCPLYSRYASNPILVTGTSGGWEETDLAAPDPFFDPPNNRWVIDYSGFSVTTGNWQRGLAYNSDITNLGGWVKEATNPVINAVDGAMRWWNGKYWFWGDTNGGAEGLSIFAWTSSTLPNAGGWALQNGGNPVITHTAGYDSNGLFDIQVQILADNSLVMYYGATDASSHRTIAVATSTDGITWTRIGALFTNAPFDPTNAELGAVWVSALGTTYQAPQFMITDGAGDSKYTSRYSSQIYFDGTNYHRRGQMLVPIGTGWEKAQVFDTNEIVVAGVRYLFYAGATIAGSTQGLNAQIGVATAPNVAP